jgi:hypothetical protein
MQKQPAGRSLKEDEAEHARLEEEKSLLEDR